jgi:hypothetical protein
MSQRKSSGSPIRSITMSWIEHTGFHSCGDPQFTDQDFKKVIDQDPGLRRKAQLAAVEAAEGGELPSPEHLTRLSRAELA